MNRHLRVARNILALLINQIGTWTLTLIYTFVVPPYLGASTYGLYAFLVTYTGFTALFIGLGTGTYLTWRIAREPEQAPRLTFNTLMLQLPLGLVSSAVALLILPTMDSDTVALHLTLILLASTLVGTFTGTCSAALGGLQIMRTPAFISLGSAALGTIAMFVCVQLNLGVMGIAISLTAGQMLGLIVMLAYTQHKIHLRPRVEPRLWPRIIAGGLPFFTWSVVLLFYWQVDIPMLKVMSGDTVVGWYAIANRIIAIPVFLPTIVTTAILPALSHERTADSPAFRAITSRSIRLVTAVTVPACVGTVILASSLPVLLHYPATFNQAIPLIQILAFNMPFVALDMVLGTVLIALGRQKAWTVVGVVAAVINPLVNLWAIPYTQQRFGNGAIGASLSTLLSEVIMLVGALYLRPRHIFTRWDVWYIARCWLAAVVMLPAVFGLSNATGLHVLRAVAYGIVVYALAAYALQVVRNEDLRSLFGVVSDRLGMASPEELGSRIQSMFTRAGSRARGRMSTARAAVSGPLARAGAVISEPLEHARAAISQPLGRARGIVSGPLARVGEKMSAVADRYWTEEPVATGQPLPEPVTPDGEMTTAPLPGRVLQRYMAERDNEDVGEPTANDGSVDPEGPTLPRQRRVYAGVGLGTTTSRHTGPFEQLTR